GPPGGATGIGPPGGAGDRHRAPRRERPGAGPPGGATGLGPSGGARRAAPDPQGGWGLQVSALRRSGGRRTPDGAQVSGPQADSGGRRTPAPQMERQVSGHQGGAAGTESP
ncbi:unnamed protein product, partial [Staurois parvus]